MPDQPSLFDDPAALGAAMDTNLSHQQVTHPDDVSRLARQLRAVRHALLDGEWHTLAELSATLGYPEASISARIRDLRKADFGGHTILRRRHASGQHSYFLNIDMERP